MDRIPTSILINIVVHAISFDLTQPPSVLYSLRATCTRLHRALSRESLPSLYRILYEEYFDTKAPRHRGFRPYVANSSSTGLLDHMMSGDENFERALRVRFMSLAAVCQRLPRAATPEVMWVLYLMILEDDGGNSRHLHHVRARDFYQEYILSYLLSPDAWSRREDDDESTVSMTVALWSFWLLSTTESLDEISKETSMDLMNALLVIAMAPLVHCSIISTLGHALLPSIHHVAGLLGQCLFRHDMIPACVGRFSPPSDGATHADYVRLNVSMDRLVGSISPSVSAAHDSDVVRMFSTGLHCNSAYVPGSLTGHFEGRYLPCGISAGKPVCRSRQPMQCHFEEYYRRPSPSNLSRKYSDEDWSDNLRDNFMRHDRYRRLDAGRTASSKSDSYIYVVGHTDDEYGRAWGHSSYYGRVRLSDGVATIRRIPAERLDGDWVFQGTLYASRCLVGTYTSHIPHRNTPCAEGDGLPAHSDAIFGSLGLFVLAKQRGGHPEVVT